MDKSVNIHSIIVLMFTITYHYGVSDCSFSLCYFPGSFTPMVAILNLYS